MKIAFFLFLSFASYMQVVAQISDTLFQIQNKEIIDDDSSMFAAFEKEQLYGDSIPFAIIIRKVVIQDSTLFNIFKGVYLLEHEYSNIFPLCLVADKIYTTIDNDTIIEMIIETSIKRLVVDHQTPFGYFYYNNNIVFVFGYFPSKLMQFSQHTEKFGWFEGENVKEHYFDTNRVAKYYINYKQGKYYLYKMDS